MCVTVNWYPPALSISLDSEEEEGRVQWRGLECRVRCGTCAWTVVRCGNACRTWQRNRNCYHNSNCFDNSEATATMHSYNVTYA